MQKGPDLFCDVCNKKLVGFSHSELADRAPGKKELRHFCSTCAIEIFDFILELKEQWKTFNTTVQDAVTKLAEEQKWMKEYLRKRDVVMPPPQTEEVIESTLPIIGEKPEEKDEERVTQPSEEEQPSQEESPGSGADAPTPDISPPPDQGIEEPAEPEDDGISESRDPFQDEEDSGGPEKA